MVKRQRTLVFLFIFILAIQVKATVVFVAPDPVTNESCTDTGHRLLPCYSLHQLSDLETLLSYTDEVTLFFFSGRHVLSEHTSFRVLNTKNLELVPYLWNKHKVLVECQVPAYIEFQDIGYLHISATTFVSCTLNLTRVLAPAYERKLTIVNCEFMNNGINYAVIASHVDIMINHCIFYFRNGAIDCLNKTFVGYEYFKISISNTKFFRNITESQISTGSALSIRNSRLTVDKCQFIQNAAIFGGAIYSEFCIILVKNTMFINNSAQDSGGALCCLYTRAKIIHSQFYNNSAKLLGGAMYFIGLDSDHKNNEDSEEEELILSNTNFTYNHAGLDGGALYCKGDIGKDTIFGRIGTSYSKFNSAVNGGFAYLSNCHITKYGFEVSHNNAINGGAYYAQESTIDFSGIINNVSYNIARDKGGALFLRKSQIKIFYRGQQILFEHNMVTSVNGKGGAIFVLDSSCETTTYSENQCFVYDYRHTSNKTLLQFTGNEANQGSVLYGGLLDRCLPPPRFRRNRVFNVIQEFKRISAYERTPLAISSEPIGVCLCVNDSRIDCSLNGLNFTKMRGESMKLTIAAIDQDENLVPSIITASYKEVLSAQLKQGERSTEISNRCTNLKYHIFTHLQAAILVLEPSENPLPLSNITIYITIIPCSRGFEQQENTCVCDRRLVNFVLICNVDTQSIQRVGSIWLKYDKNYLRIHANCPFDYCEISEYNISLISPDDQCTNGRSGVLCGACQDNLSITLGGSRCLLCTSRLTAVWLIVVFALAGVALVALLLICNITISSGTLNGVIFYVNVVATSGLTNLHANGSIHPILSVFIAWLNLDLGVETCFYPGMDTYQKTWLQFAFPLYVWLLVAAIIVASYYSTKAMKLFGRNNIAILATLFLLSYSKLLKTIITTLSFTMVWKGSADNVSDPLVTYKVWSFDGNVEYLKGQHIALFVVGLLFLLFPFLPYTLLLVFGQCIRSMSLKRWGLTWIRSIAFVSILDAYHAPYKNRHRYWTGLVLLTRCILFLAFATNSTDKAVLTNMFTVTLVVVGILIIKTRISNIYRQVYIETLELCFLLNLGVLSATLCYLLGKDNSEQYVHEVITASISVSFIIFFGILVYHSYLQIKKTKYYPALEQFFLKRRWQRQLQTVPTDANHLDGVVLNYKLPTTTIIELSEKLLESDH